MREPRTWPGRLLRGWQLDRNPLRRRLDRIETLLLLLLITASAAGAPAAYHAAKTWTYQNGQREAASQRAALRQAPATLLEDPSGFTSDGYTTVSVPEAKARWTSPDGHQVTGDIPARSGLRKGSTELIWVDRSGHLASAPMPQSQIADRADLAGAASIAALALLTLGLAWLGRYALDRRRLAAWDTDWRVTGPLWTSRR